MIHFTWCVINTAEDLQGSSVAFEACAFAVADVMTHPTRLARDVNA